MERERERDTNTTTHTQTEREEGRNTERKKLMWAREKWRKIGTGRERNSGRKIRKRRGRKEERVGQVDRKRKKSQPQLFGRIELLGCNVSALNKFVSIHQNDPTFQAPVGVPTCGVETPGNGGNDPGSKFSKTPWPSSRGGSRARIRKSCPGKLRLPTSETLISVTFSWVFVLVHI